MSKFSDPCFTLLVFSQHGWQVNILKQCPVWGLQLFFEVCLVSGVPDVIKRCPFQRPFPLPFSLPLEHRHNTLFICTIFALFFASVTGLKSLFPFSERQLFFPYSNVNHSSLHFDYDSWQRTTARQWVSSTSNKCINLKYKHNNSSRKTFFFVSLSKQNMSLDPKQEKEINLIRTDAKIDNRSDNLRKAWSNPNYSCTLSRPDCAMKRC